MYFSYLKTVCDLCSGILTGAKSSRVYLQLYTLTFARDFHDEGVRAVGHTGQIVFHHIWESRISLFMFCWSWFKFTVVHIWRAELDNSWAVTGNTISSVSVNRHEAIGQANASMSSALSEQTGPQVKVPSHSLPAQPPDCCDRFSGIFPCGGSWWIKLFLSWSAINYWDQVYIKIISY